MNVDAEKLVSALFGPPASIDEAALQAVLAHREQTVPVMLAHLERWAADPEAAPWCGDDRGPVNVIGVLAYLRVAAAHRPLVVLAWQDPEFHEGFFGDFVASGLGPALLATADGDLAGIREILGDDHAGEYGYSAAVGAFGAAALQGWIDREEAIEVLFATLDALIASEDGSPVPSDVFVALFELGAHHTHHERMVEAHASGEVGDDIDRAELDDPNPPMSTDLPVVLRRLAGGIEEWVAWSPPPRRVAAPSPPPAPAVQKVGRNDPCPCGSGKKYKACHLASGPGFRPVEPGPPRVAALAALDSYTRTALVEERAEAEAELWGDLGPRREELFARDPEAERTTEAVLDGWFWFDRPMGDGRKVAPTVLANRTDLPPAAASWIRRMSQTQMSLYEVVDVRPGASITLRDVLDGDTVQVHERTLSRAVRRGHALALRILGEGASGQPEIELSALGFSGFAAASLAEHLHRVREDLRWRYRRCATPDAVFYRLVPEVLFRAWVEEVLDPKFPEVRNTDGEDILWTEVHFDIRDEAAARAALDALFEATTDGWRWATESVSLGLARIEGERLVVECNSRERGDRARALVEAEAGTAVRHRATSHRDIAAEAARMAAAAGDVPDA